MNRRTPLRTLVPLLALAALVLSLAACSPTPPAETPGITGTVTSVVPGDGRPASMLVEGGKQPVGAISDKASVTIQPSTLVFGPDGAPAQASTIVTGATVSVWLEGPVAESYPVQGSAKAVQVIKAP